jgi:osmotically-inducible protein OsmY
VETMFVEASCAGVRTSIAWLANGKRIHVLVCAEDETRSTASLKKRQAAQKDLKAWKAVTACVRAGEVHLLGWAQSAAEKEKLAAVAKRHGLVDKVEVLGEGERE